MDHPAHVAFGPRATRGLRNQGVAALLLGAVVSACACDDPAPKRPAPTTPTSSVVASVSATPPRTPRPKNPAPKAEAFNVTTTDGVRIEASSYRGGEVAAPVVVLVHRLGGTRAEWTPLLERLFPAKHPMNVVTLDLRGHGESRSAKGHPKADKGKISWQKFDQKAFEKMDLDLAALAAHVEKQKGGPPRFWILVGSDLGATLVVRHAAKREGDVAGLALVSPGAALRGLDLYEPFGSVLKRPNLLMAGVADTVSYQPVKALAAMSKTSKLVTFEARGHGAEFLGEERWEVWDDLAEWVEARAGSTASAATSAAASSSAAPPAAAPSSSASSGR